MPIYEFQSDDGEKIEKFYLVAKAPNVGKTIKHKGKKYVRIMSLDTQIEKGFKPYVSYTLAKGQWPDLKLDPKTGRSIIETRQQEKNLARHAGMDT